MAENKTYMNISDLRYIRCPYCSSTIRLQRSIDRRENRIRLGVAFCDCDSYPIFESILILQKPINRIVLDDILNQKYQRAFNRLINLQWGYNRFLKMTGPHTKISQAYERIFSRQLLNGIGYANTIRPLLLFPSSRAWAQYLLRLPQAPESKILRALLSWMPKQPSVIIDVGCGITPYAVFSKTLNATALIGIDKSFALLYLSSVFFKNHHQSLVCTDLSQGFPVKPNVADLTFSLNCFTYLYNQMGTLRSMIGSTKTRGAVFLGDMHESIYPPQMHWYPRKPIFYTTGVTRAYKIMDYDNLVIHLDTPVALSSLPPVKYRGRGRYGIIFTHKRIQK